jgi:Zn-dependent protease
LHGLLCGVPLRIRPLFWAASAALGIRYYADPEAGSAEYFALWMVAVLVCVLLSALGQALVGRAFGMRGSIVLYGLGSLISGVDSLPRCRQRVAVLLSGPLISLLLLAGIWGLTELIPFPATQVEWGWRSLLANGLVILVRINLGWGLLNLLPLWPLAGGRIASDVGETLWGKRGQIAAVVLSLAVTAVLSVWVILEMGWRMNNLRYDPRYAPSLEECGILLLFCFFFWIRSFRTLWPENPPAARQRTEDRG